MDPRVVPQIAAPVRRLSLILGLTAGWLLAAAPAPAAPPELPPPSHPATVSEEVLIPMDDGVRLGATVTFPSDDGASRAPGRFPVVLSMTPYGRSGLCGCPPPELFATRGMIAAVVDVRGTGGSEGNLEENYFSPREARDGYLLVEHLGTRPYSTGRVGMAGGSYVGITQYLTAGQRPPHLAAITPAVAISDLYRDGFAHGGVPSLFFDLQYLAVQGLPGAAGVNTDPALLAETIGAKLGQSLPGEIAFDYLARPDDDPFYRERSPITTADRIEVPVLNIGGWHDGLLRGTIEMHAALARRGGVETRLYVDPCTHKGCGPPFAPLTNPPGLEDLSAVIFEFLDQHLRGAEVPDRPPVTYYLQGPDAYQEARRWPPQGVRYEQLRLGDGVLEPGPARSEGDASYVTNPVAGLSMALSKYGTVGATPYLPTDQRLEGPQGLTFRTAALERPLRIAGPLALSLLAASTATDTDWHAKLADVAPDGSETIITEGTLRASHRELDRRESRRERPYHTHTDPQPIEPGRFYGYEIEIWPTAYELAPGHRLQLRLTSTDLPTHFPGSVRLDRDDPASLAIDLHAPAVNTVRLGDSRLLVPVLGEGPGR